MKDKILGILHECAIPFELFEHPAIFTWEDTSALGLTFPGPQMKNLFLKDKKGERHALVSVAADRQVDLQALAAVLGYDRVSFASAEQLGKYLGVKPGSVTLLGVVNDHDGKVDVVIDTDVWEAEHIACHPLTNEATVVLAPKDLLRLFARTGHDIRVLTIPAKQNGSAS